MPDAPLLILAATAREAAAVRRAVRVQGRPRLASGRCWQGMAGGSRVAVVQGGIGPRRAAAAAHEGFQAFHPRALLVLGFAGGLRAEAAPGTLVLATAVQEPEGRWPGDPRLLESAGAAADGADIPCIRGELVTVAELAATPGAKAALAASTGAVAVDMEAAGVASGAAEIGLPLVVAKVIFDAPDEALPPCLIDVVRQDGSPRLLRAALLAARDREVRAALHWAGRRSRQAARVLTRFSRTFLPILGAGPP